MDPSVGQAYAELYRRHWWWRARQKVILDELRRARGAANWRTVLDIGCGDGLFFDQLAEFGDVEGVEPNAALVSKDSAHRSRIHLGPFDRSFRPAKRFSAVLMLDVLEHLKDPHVALRHAVSLLEPGGTLIATVPAFLALWTGWDDLNHHVTRYTRRTFRELARQAGLRIERECYFFHWTCPAKLCIRLKEAGVRKPPAPEKLPPTAINSALYALSRVEHLLLGPLRLPFGSSLFVAGGRQDAKGFLEDG